jgi:hypothetical protein
MDNSTPTRIPNQARKVFLFRPARVTSQLGRRVSGESVGYCFVATTRSQQALKYQLCIMLWIKCEWNEEIRSFTHMK